MACMMPMNELMLSVQLERRGFYPKGGGHAVLRVQSLAPGSSLPAFDLTERGDVTSITVSAFQAGPMKPDVAERIASAAEAALRKVLIHTLQCSLTQADHFKPGLSVSDY